MERSGFFDAYKVGEQYDRVYLAESFAQYFANFISDGVFGGKSGELQVVAMPEPKMQVSVNKGKGWIKGYWYENSEDLFLPLDVADGVLSRIDSIVVRLDYEGRFINLAVIKGAPSLNPSPAPILRNADYYDLKLAEVFVKAGAVNITQANITDTRLDNEVCGIVHSLIDQVDTSTLFEQYLSWYEQTTNQAIKDMDEFKKNFESDLMAWYESIKDILDENVAINLQNQIDELESKKADNSFVWSLSNKINNTRTYTLVHAKQNTKHTLSGLPISDGIYQCQFVAVEDFNEGDIFEGFSAKPVGEETVLPDKAFIKGDLVSLVVDANNKKLAFKIGGGGTSKLNIFAQPTRPPINEGIWLQTNDKFKNVQVANNVVQSGDWSTGNEYEDMPNVRGDFGCVSVGDNVYFIGGHVFMGMSTPGKALSNIDVYNTKTRSWSKITDMPFTNNSFGCVAIGEKIYCFGGYKNYNNIKHDTSFVFDTINGTWSELPKMPFADVNFGCAFVGKKVYCTGGESYQRKLQIFDIDNSSWSQGTEKPDTNWEIGLESLNDEIFCVGGRNGYGNAFKIVYKYNVIENTWSRVNDFPERIFDAVCISEKGKLYCAGGRTKNESGRYFQLPDSYVYDEKLDSWEHIGFLPTPAADKNGCACDGKLYLSGGWDAAGTYYKSLDVYDVDLKKWSLNANLRQPKYGHYSVEHEGKIYTFGGFDYKDFLNILEIYDAKNNVWKTGAQIPKKLAYNCCAKYKNKIYCIAGYNREEEYLDSVLVYDIDNDSWSNGNPIPIARRFFDCAIVGSKIYCIGGSADGVQNSYLNYVDVYDIENNSWSSEKPIPTPRMSHACESYGDKIYCIGGNNQVILDSLEIYDTKLKQWSTGAQMVTPKTNFGRVIVGSKIYCICGVDGDKKLTDSAYVYDVSSDSWIVAKPSLLKKNVPSCAYSGFKIYCTGGTNNSQALSSTEIMSLVPTKFPENTLVLQNTFDGKNKYYTQLINSKQLLGDRLLTGFENAWIYANEKLKEYPAYYGDGEKWNKFKN